MKNKWLLALPLTLALLFNMTPQAFAQAKAAEEKNLDKTCLSPKMVQLKTDMQKVWIDHTIWTRSYIVSAISNRPDQKDVLDLAVAEPAGYRQCDQTLLWRSHAAISWPIF